MKKRGFMTVGYGNMDVRDFVGRIKSLRANCIVDVRTRPYSKYNMAFNKEELRDRLNEEGITYFWFGNKLGGKYDKIKYCDNQGRVDYEKVAESEKFIEGIKEFEQLIYKYNVCIMCSEKDPMKCHRFLLISRALKEYNIHHIMPDFTLVKNADLEKRLFDLYGDMRQVSLFDEENAESIEELAYRKHGLKTAYVSEKVKELLSSGVQEDLPEKIKIYCIGCENKTAEQFFTLLKDFKVKRIIDVRENNRTLKAPFAMHPDIVYYLKMHCISYERLSDLIPNSELKRAKVTKSISEFFNMYAAYVSGNNSLLGLMTDELDGTCFLGNEDDYKKCYRHVITKALRRHNKNIVVRHLR